MGRPEKIQYTTLAQRYVARYRILTSVGIHINFWIAANLLLCAITFLHLKILGQVFGTPVDIRPKLFLLTGLLFGFLYGLCLGLVNYYFDKKIFRQQPLGKLLLVKTFGSLIILVLILALVRYVLFDRFISGSLNVRANALTEESWDTVFYILLIYYFFMTLVISFINQVNKKYGPGVLLPLLLGKYRKPQEEERIFMFMDLKSSTATAERLGHFKYSSFIRDCFSDINEVLLPFRAQVYQYVGDEIVVTWEESEGLRNLFCIKFYFACEEQFRSRAEYYLTNYGLLPEFKAGVHTGKVTAVEIGEIKRDIAYHGDTLNTAARIQSICNEYNRKLLASAYLASKILWDEGLKTEDLGLVHLRGKTEKIGVVSIDKSVLSLAATTKTG